MNGQPFDMEFTINNVTWMIQIVPELECWGETNADTGTIVIKDSLCASAFKTTLIHELTHAYLYSYGMFYDRKSISEEELCEFVACNIKSIYDLYENICDVLTLSKPHLKLEKLS